MLRARALRSLSQSAVRQSKRVVCQSRPIVPCNSTHNIATLCVSQQHQLSPLTTTVLWARQLHTTTALRADVIDVEGPAFADSVSEGDIMWQKKVGDFVKEDEVVAGIETDKTTVDVPAPQSGIIKELLVEDGATVTAKQPLFRLEPGDAPAGGAPAAADKPKPKEDKPKPAESSKPAAEAPKPAPAAPSPAPQQPSSAAGSAPSKPPAPQAAKPSAPMGTVAPPPSVPVPAHVNPTHAVTGQRAVTRVKMNRMRQRIAARLKEAQNTYAMLTTFNEIDMTNIIEMRQTYQKQFEKKHGVKIGFMSPFIRAAAYALQDQPVVNAVIEDGEMIYRHYVDLSVAVATPKGLVVPALRNVESMNYAAIEHELRRLGQLARDGQLAIEDMEGGTFTISNGGVFGSRFGTPIINPPQSAILGMHAIVDRPVAINGKVEIRPMMTVALTYDHRLIDGREAVTFLTKIKAAVEDPRVMLMDL